MKAQTGTSTTKNPAEAGREAAGKAKAGLSKIKLAFVYSGVQYDQKALLAAVAAEMPGVPLIGNTSFTGIITSEGYVTGDDGFIGILALADDGLTVGRAAAERGGDPRETGRKVARAALTAAGRRVDGKIEAPAYFYMVASPGEEEYYLKGIADVIGRVPCFGGSAADNAIAGEWSLFTDELITANGVAVAFFYTDAAFANVFTGAYEESENVGVITKIKGDRTLVEIDGVPAVKKYAEWTKQNPDDLLGMKLLIATITAPLGIKDRLGDLTAIRHPMNGNDDYSMNIGANLAVNTAVIQMRGDANRLIASVGENIRAVKSKIGARPAALHLVHCGGRRAGIGERIEEVARAAKEAAGDSPFMVEFTFGEYGYEDDGNNTTGGLMLSFTALA
ncbi:histidine kinase [Betaproteobacteria bacterium]|nr:histidine kinase [Betaproteobacteria bacterium]